MVDAAVTDASVRRDATQAIDSAGVMSVNSPVAYFRFEEPAGSQTFTDSSGNGSSGVLEADVCACMSVPGKTGKGLKFTDVNAYNGSGVRLVSTPMLESTDGAMTVSAWFFQTGSRPDHASVFSRRCGDSYEESFNLSVSGSDITLFSNCVGNTVLIAPNSARFMQWVHAAGTFDGRQMRLYVDGVLMALQPRTGVLSHDPADSFYIGTNLNHNDNPEPFVGVIDEVAVWNRALTAFEVTQLFKGTSPLTLSP